MCVGADGAPITCSEVEMSEHPIASDEQLDDMFSNPEGVSREPDELKTQPSSRGRGRLTMVALLAAGAAVGAIAVTQINHSSSATTTANTAPAANAMPGGQLPPAAGNAAPQGGPAGGGGPGGLSGEQHVSGTVTKVGSSTVTVKSTSGTATYTVTSASQIIRNGQTVPLSAVKAGDPVFVHAYPSSGTTVIERLFAGSSATQAQQGPAGPPPNGAPGQQSGATSTT
jgi:hypothetical protein